mgnify:FL=1
MTITKETPIAMLTVGQLQEILGLSEKHIVKPTTEIKNERRYVYGLAGIRRLFNVSHVTAQKYKDTIIADACFQQGRKINGAV